MANFTNNITSVGQLYQAENMTFGGAIGSTADLQRQVADLQALLARSADLPAETVAPVTQALAEASAIPAAEPGAGARIVDKLKGAKGILEAVTGVAAQASPLIGAIGAVIAAATGLLS